MKRYIILLLTVLTLGFSGVAFSGETPETTDLYIYGYITALLKERYGIDPNHVTIRGGVVFLDEVVTKNEKVDQIYEELLSIPGVDYVQTVPEEHIVLLKKVWVFPDGTLFDPLIADPRWPSFYAGYNYYINSTEDLKNVVNVAFGKGFPIVRRSFNQNKFMELGLQAGVFAFFDIDSPSFDLINADYFIGVPLSFRYDNFSWFLRYHHQSSHLGDEYIIHHNSNVNRINLSYEKLDAVLSYDVSKKLRVYGGGGYFTRTDPASFKKLSYQFGLEAHPILSYQSKRWSLLFATHVTGLEETNYEPSISSRLGMYFGQRYLISLDLFHGYSPNGQFYNKKDTWVGIGLHLF